MTSTLRGQSLSDPNRLRALRATGLLDSPPEESFDRITECLKTSLQCDSARISLLDEARQFFKSTFGLPVTECPITETPLSHSFCQYVVTGGQPLRIVDARQDPLVANNPAINDGVIAYLGTPLVTSDGFILGSLCAVCGQPREWSERDLRIMQLLADNVMTEIRLRDSNTVIIDTLREMENIHLERDRIMRSLFHDLRTPAAAILSCLELMEDDGPPLDENRRELLEIIRSSGDQLMEMMDGLLNLGRLESGRPLTKWPVDIPSLLQKVYHTAQPLASDANHELVIHYPPNGVSLPADESLLRRVLLNLLSNAVKYCPAGSRISFGVEERDGEGVFCVQDTGPGIPDHEKAEIFEGGYSGTNASHGGQDSFGLGLDFCKKAVVAHGGTIHVEDAPGGGSLFIFTIPKSTGEPQENPPAT